MKRKGLVLLLILTLITMGCSSKKKPPAHDNQTPAPGETGTTVTPPLTTPPGTPPETPTESELLRRQKEEFTVDGFTTLLTTYVNERKGEPAPALTTLFERWQLKHPADAVPLVEADLNGDGVKEVVTAFSYFQGGGNAVFVVHKQNDRYVVDRFSDDPDRFLSIHAVADLTGDGRPEVVWSSTERGAHTSFHHVVVSNWKPGELTPLPGEMGISMMELKLDGKDLLLSGGTVGSAGAGMAQRTRTDRYRWEYGQFQLVDQSYATSNFGYHRLQDGIVAETFNRLDDARQAYQQAMEASREPLRSDMIKPDLEGSLGPAVQAFARFRLGALSLRQEKRDEARQVLEGAEGPYAGLSQALLKAGAVDGGCQAAAAWAREHPQLVDGLNSPMGYANPQWDPDSLCGALPQT